MLNIVVIILVWWLIGVAGFIFWWTREFEMEKEDFFESIVVGILGPFVWVMGWFINGSGYKMIKKIFK